ncbi:BCD family MFS transporter [Rhodomicrobium sp. Az07]|uniref:BCD family MFS transporter n=1 Tax=Rhodomicrobium sp. Az07 TaxID=2839034 RepID=UPI001BEBE1CF|nr:BCD family MFS transporter [Rhodomicrobium sp. Az07]MBT3070342.1 BCD family MFS transporter [Rhodomicrobium sp. Az07]
MSTTLGWFGIVRLGLVQMALGGIVALATSTLNRVMVVELLLPATLPGLLFGIHYAAEMLRPRWGHGSDKGGKRTPWIIGGMAVLALSGVGAAGSIALMSTNTTVGIACAVLAYIGIGIGAGAAGTSLLVLVAKLTAPERKATAAAIVWTLMISGTALAAGFAGYMLAPFSMERLIGVSAAISAIAFAIAVIAIWGVERRVVDGAEKPKEKPAHSFIEAMKDVMSERDARRMTIFIFISMLAFSAQELLLEPFAGSVFGLTPAETAQLFGMHRAGIVLGMVMGGLIGIFSAKSTSLGRYWVAGGCFASSAGLFALAAVGLGAEAAYLTGVVFTLGIANGIYAVAAIGTMISMANIGKGSREGVRMGMWGAAQAVAFGLGGVIGTASVDVARAALGSAAAAYSLMFIIQGVLFAFSTYLAFRLTAATQAPADSHHEPEPSQLTNAPLRVHPEQV